MFVKSKRYVESALCELPDEEPEERRGKVWRAVGFTDLALSLWLIRFGEINLDEAVPQKLAELREELSAFIELANTPAAKRDVMFGARPSPSVKYRTAVAELTALEANRWLRNLLANLEQNQPTPFAPRITCSIRRVQNAQGWALIPQMDGPPLDLFQLHTYNIIASSGRAHRVCPHCGRTFIPERRQEYCSRTCSGNTRKTRWRTKQAKRRRENPAEARASAHRHYEKKLKKQVGLSDQSKVVIKRRPRSER